MAEHVVADDLAVYALGALAGDERDRVEQHLASHCPACAGELAELSRAVELLAFASTPVAPSAGLKERVTRMAAGSPVPPRERSGRRAPVREPLPFPPSSRPERRAWLALAAALVLAAALGSGWWSARREAERLAGKLVEARAETARAATALARTESETAWLRDPRVQVAILKGLAGAENAKARLVWHPESKRGMLYVDGLPPLPLTKSYELWAFVGATPKPAGTFEAGANGTAVISLRTFDAAAERPTKFAVSVEPKGGVPSPTGAVVLLGESS